MVGFKYYQQTLNTFTICSDTLMEQANFTEGINKSVSVLVDSVLSAGCLVFHALTVSRQFRREQQVFCFDSSWL